MRTSILLPLLLLAPASQAQRTASSLFLDAGESVPRPAGSAAHVAERRPVDLRLELLATPVRAGSVALELELFGGETLTVLHRGTEAAYGGTFLWTGAVAGRDDADVVLAVTGEAVQGSIRIGDQLVRLRPDGEGRHWLERIDESAFAGCGTESAATPAGPRRAAAFPSGEPERATEAPTIDVLVAYTPQALASVGGTNAMTSLINLAVTETNQAYAACGVTQRLQLVHAEEMVGYSEPGGFSTILSHLTSKSDGRMDEVHALRDQYGADAVSLICNNGQYCGQAHLMTNVGPGFESLAFSVTNYSCATGYYSFGHELGHNFGSHHDPANAGGAAYNYSYGYRTPNSQYRTVMAYSPGTRVKVFSSPNATWAGNTMGSASQDNARSMNNTGPTVAAWRAAMPVASTLASTPMRAGAEVVFSVGNATPFGTALVGYSLTGGGPTATPWGTAAMTPPIHLLATLPVRENGAATYVTAVPPGTSGLTIWLQGYDPATGLLGNGIEATVQ